MSDSLDQSTEQAPLGFLRDAVSRRTFLTRMTAAGLGTAAAALIAGCGGSGNGSGGSSSTPGTGLTAFADPKNFPNIPGANENVVVLNYALTLETLEADLYRQALNIASGVPLATPLSANPATDSRYSLAVGTGGLSSEDARIGFLYLKQYAGVEAAHRDFLRAAITAAGATPVPANPNGYTTGLAAGSDLKTILTLIRTVEETGVRAYEGAAPFLTSLALVQTAVSIYSTEARHSAGMNYILSTKANRALDIGPSSAYGGAQPAPTAAFISGYTYTNIDGTPASKDNIFDYYLAPTAVLAAVKPFFL